MVSIPVQRENKRRKLPRNKAKNRQTVLYARKLQKRELLKELLKREHQNPSENETASSKKYPKAQRNVQDTVFRALFREPEYLKELADELVGPLPEGVKIENTTIESILASNGILNDLSFSIQEGSKKEFIVLMEAQSYWQDNIVVRLFFYFAQLLENYIGQGDTPITKISREDIPKIRLFIVYTGNKEKPEIFSFKRDFAQDPDSGIDVIAKVITVKNAKGILKQYAQFCEIYNKNKENKNLSHLEAIRKTIEECIAKDILKDFLTRHEMEVLDIMEQVYTQETIIEKERLWFAKQETEKVKREMTKEIEKAEAKAEKFEEQVHLMQKKEEDRILRAIQDGFSLKLIARMNEIPIEKVKQLAKEHGINPVED